MCRIKCGDVSMYNISEKIYSDTIKNYITSDFSSLSEIKKEINYIQNIINKIKHVINFNNNKIIKIDKKRVFCAIKDYKNNIQLKKMIKYGGITSGVFGSISLAYSMLEK